MLFRSLDVRLTQGRQKYQRPFERAADQARAEANEGGDDAQEQAARGVQLDNYDQAR